MTKTFVSCPRPARAANGGRRNVVVGMLVLAGPLSTLGGRACASQAAVTIRVVTEELPPYNMTRNGHVTGVCTEVVEALMREVGVTARIESMPWERALETATHAPNVLIYSIDRTAQREHAFKWVGEIGPPDSDFLYSLPERHLLLKTLDDARSYRVATVHGDSREDYLLSKGFVVGKNLVRSNKFESSYEMLRLGRVDLWLTGELSAPYLARLAGDDPKKTLRKSLELGRLTKEMGALLAFGAQTPDALVQRFRDGLDTLRRDGRLAAIHKKWS